jgi:hypothetical protein
MLDTVMAKSSKSAPNRHTRRAAGASQKLLPIFTDPNFVRVYADHVVVMALGHDIDLAFVATGPKLDTMTSRADSSLGTSVNMTPSYSEVARVRMPPASAASSAMSILQKMTEQGFIDKAELIKSVEEFQEPDPEVADDELDKEVAA